MLNVVLHFSGIFKFFGTAYRQNTTSWDFSPLFKAAVSDVCDGDQGVALETLGDLGEVKDGKCLLSQSG